MFFHCRITDVHSVKVERLLLPLLPVCECRNNTTPAYYLKIGDFHCLLPLCVHVCRRHKSCKFKYKSLNLTCYGKDFVFLHFQSDFSFIFFFISPSYFYMFKENSTHLSYGNERYNPASD